jgi:hypothetical protein
VCLACADAWLLSYDAVTERGALFLQFSSKLLLEVFVLFPSNSLDALEVNEDVVGLLSRLREILVLEKSNYCNDAWCLILFIIVS